MNRNPVIVYVGDEQSAEQFVATSQSHVLAAATYRSALSQVIFSHPDAIILNAGDDILSAEDTFFHLQSIDHPLTIILSDVEGRWATSDSDHIIVLPQDSSAQYIHNIICETLWGDKSVIY